MARPTIARSFDDRLNIEVIRRRACPRSAATPAHRLATTKYVLFIDADIELEDPTLLRRAMATMIRRNLQCLTTNIWCSNGTSARSHAVPRQRLRPVLRLLDQALCHRHVHALRQDESSMHSAASTKRRFYAEDYLLSKQVSPRRFGIVRGSVSTTNRRFQKMGHLKIVRMFLKTAFNTWNENYFLRDHEYWKEA